MARTLVRGSTQVMGESIYDAQIAVDAEIQLSKIENWEDIVTTTGTVNGDIDMGTNQIKNLAPGTETNDAVTKGQLDSIAAGLDPKNSCRAATTGGNITLANTQIIDGVSLSVGDRVLVKDQTDATENGIYVVVTGGNWVRSDDADGTNNNVSGGMFTFIEEGTNNADTGWVVISDGTIDVGNDDIAFAQFTGGGALTAGSGIDLTGNVISVKVDDSTTEINGSDQVIVKALGITQNELAVDSVVTSKIVDGDVTGIKLDDAVAGAGLIHNATSHALDVRVDGSTIVILSEKLSVANGGIDTTQLADGSVTIDKLAGSIASDGIYNDGTGLAVNVDDLTIEVNGSDKLQIKDGGIGTTQLADASVTKEKIDVTDLAGVALAKGGTDELDVQVDDDTIKVNGSNELYVNPAVMLSASNYVVREPLAVTADNQTVMPALTAIPVTGTEMVFVNGVLMDLGSGNDYTISNDVITFTFGLRYNASHPEKCDKVLVTYFK